jgi:hypothetical protein
MSLAGDDSAQVGLYPAASLLGLPLELRHIIFEILGVHEHIVWFLRNGTENKAAPGLSNTNNAIRSALASTNRQLRAEVLDRLEIKGRTNKYALADDLRLLPARYRPNLVDLRLDVHQPAINGRLGSTGQRMFKSVHDFKTYYQDRLWQTSAALIVNAPALRTMKLTAAVLEKHWTDDERRMQKLALEELVSEIIVGHSRLRQVVFALKTAQGKTLRETIRSRAKPWCTWTSMVVKDALWQE